MNPEETSSVRRLDCARVGACLKVAIARNWRAFTCKGCPAYERLTPVELQRELVPTKALALYVVRQLDAANDNR